MRHHTRLKRALTLGLALALTLNGVPAYAIEEVGMEEASEVRGPDEFLFAFAVVVEGEQCLELR